MEAQSQAVSPVAVGLRFGLLTAAVAVLVDFLLRIIRINVLVYGAISLIAGIVVAITGIVLAHRAFKRANDGLMSYGQGVLITIVAIMIWAIISALFNYVYVYYIDPDFVDRMKDEMTAFLERQRMPDAQIARSTAAFDELRPSLDKALLKGLTNGAIGGVLLGLIISAFTKRKALDFE